MTKVNTPGLTEEWPHLRSFANGEVTMPKKWTTAVEIENAELRERIELLEHALRQAHTLILTLRQKEARPGPATPVKAVT